MKKKNVILVSIILAALICCSSGCNNKSDNAGASGDDSKTSVSAQSDEENTSAPDISGHSEQDVSENSVEFSYPDFLVGEWNLKLDVESADESIKKEAEERMSKTSMVLYSDGNVLGYYDSSSVAGSWGVYGGYLYISLSNMTEKFEYNSDTITSVNSPDMSFVKK